MSVLEVRELRKSYKVGFIPRPKEVLKGVSFSVHESRITGFLGANGAGKTTTMKCILGLAFPDSGALTYFGDQGLTMDVRRRIGYLPERPYFYEYLTGVEFLKFYGQISTSMKSQALKDRIDFLLKEVDLVDSKNSQLRTYSKGMLQKIGIAQALIHEPELVILDEPMSGLDPDGRYFLAQLIREVAKKGTAVFLSSHVLNDAEKLCEDVVIMKEGLVIYEGRTKKLLNDMSGSIEISYFPSSSEGDPDVEKIVRVENLETLQPAIRRILESRGTVIEIKHLRASLEEAFVKMALKGNLIK